MSARSLARVAAVALIAAAAGFSRASVAARDISASARELRALPPVIFWAWERREDLRGLDPARAGVAYLAATCMLAGDRVRLQPRAQPLFVDPGTPLIAVVRIEVDRAERSDIAAVSTVALARELADLARRVHAAALQIDFDATESQRSFYLALIADTRRALGDTPISITALASWCSSESWLDAADIDEAVPMLFRLGVANGAAVKRRGAQARWSSQACMGAVGVSTDEPTPPLTRGRRTYIFRPRGWTPRDAQDVLAQIGTR
jgi:hypothetical protein